MAFIPIPNSIQVCRHFTLANQKMQMCIVVKNDAGAPTIQDLTDAATIGKDWWTNTLKAHQSQALSLVEVVATDMTSQGAPQIKTAVNTTGGITNNPVPNNVAAVASLRTALRGRSYRGRMYLPGIPHDDLQDSVSLTSARAATVVSDWGTLLLNFSSGGYTPVVASMQHNGAVTNPAHTEAITTVVCDLYLDSQRRRLFGRGK